MFFYKLYPGADLHLCHSHLFHLWLIVCFEMVWVGNDFGYQASCPACAQPSIPGNWCEWKNWRLVSRWWRMLTFEESTGEYKRAETRCLLDAPVQGSVLSYTPQLLQSVITECIVGKDALPVAPPSPCLSVCLFSSAVFPFRKCKATN